MASVAQRQSKSAGGVKRAANRTQKVAEATAPTPSLYDILHRRVIELAENMTVADKSKPQPEPEPAPSATGDKRRPRKLEMRLQTSKPDAVSFSAPFLDNTLNKMLALQNNMLKLGNDVAKNDDIEESIKKEQFAQSAELSRIIALICAEKARQSE